MDHLWPGLRPRLEVILTTMREHCPDSLACLDYARQIIHCLKNSDKNRQKGTETHKHRPRAKISAPDLQNLVEAKAEDLPEDLGQFLRKSLSTTPTTGGRNAVARIGHKRLSPLTEQDQENITRITAGLRARFHAMLQASRRVRQRPSGKGKLDPRRTHGIALGKRQVFLAYQRKPAINTAFHTGVPRVTIVKFQVLDHPGTTPAP